MSKHQKTEAPGEAELMARIDALFDEGRWDEALVQERLLADHWHRTLHMWAILNNILPKVEELKGEGSASSLFLLGFMYYLGAGGVENNYQKAFRLFSRAAQLGHVLALYIKGIQLCNGNGAARDPAAALACVTEAADAGCKKAALHAAQILNYWETGQPDYSRAAWYYLLSKEEWPLGHLMRSHPVEVCPFGRWTPDTRLQRLVLPAVRQAQFIWMLVAKRIGMDRNVACLILPYICTRSGWPDDLKFELKK